MAKVKDQIAQLGGPQRGIFLSVTDKSLWRGTKVTKVTND
jgi:hypothetical protein